MAPDNGGWSGASKAGYQHQGGGCPPHGPWGHHLWKKNPSQNTRIPPKTWVEAKDKTCRLAQPKRAGLELLWVPPVRQPQPPLSLPSLVKLGPQGMAHHGQGLAGLSV